MIDIQKIAEMLGDPTEFGVSPSDVATMKTHYDKRMAADRELASATARLFMSEDGRRVLEALMRDTVLMDDNYPEMLVSLTPEQVHAYSLMRKGQNSFVRMILKVIREVEAAEKGETNGY